MDRTFRHFEKNQTKWYNIFKYYPFNNPDLLNWLEIITVIYLAAKLIKFAYNEMTDYNFGNTNFSCQDLDFKEYTDVIQKEVIFSDYKAMIYSMIPWRLISRLWGGFTDVNWLWGSFGNYAQIYPFIWLTGVNMDEAYVAYLLKTCGLHSVEACGPYKKNC